jgi:uncharacterized heparinase superfamily protein
MQMSKTDDLTARWSRLMNGYEARRAAWSKPATAFISQPEPRTIGSFARGRQLAAGNFVFAGTLIEAPDLSLWDLPAPDDQFRAEQHGFGWLDDLAAAGDAAARHSAQKWLAQWIERYGNGTGPGWTPELTGRRLVRWITHALFLMAGQGSTISGPFLRLLAQQTMFLSRRWKSSTPGLPRFEALTGLLYASLSLEGMERHLEPTLKALDQDCISQIGVEGGLPTRNPEELLEVFTLLTWAALALSETGHTPSDAHWSAIERIAPTLRTLRHADGSLARFHGGGRGLEGRLDSALATSGVKSRAPDGLSMGFARLSAGRTSLIVDAAAPPRGRASANAHASTLAFELTSGRRPLIVNCGSGASFGPEWRRAGRATPSHSTLILASRSSSRLGSSGESLQWLEDTPTDVPIQLSQGQDGIRFEGGHNGYARRYGLTHIRKLDLSFDGRALVGEDTLMTLDPGDRTAFDTALDATRLKGIPFDIRFHLHPDVDASVDMGGSAVSMALKSGEIWIFRVDDKATLSLDASVYLETARLKPRATKQIVLSGTVMQYASRVRWSLAKAQDTPTGVRDLVTEEVDPLAVD